MSTKILFVCTGNTCRSPVAESLLRAMARREGLELEVRSAGVAAIDGLPLSKHSRDILEAKGADSNLTSRSLTGSLAEWADLILTMTMSHKSSVIQRFPQTVEKVYTLKEYAEDGGWAQEALRKKEELISELQLKQALGQTITASELEQLRALEGQTPDYNIGDPYGGRRADYEECAAEIEDALRKLLRKLKK